MVLAAVLALLAMTLGALAGRAAADETTGSADTLRTGWDSHEPGLSPASVEASDFGQVFSTQVDGQVYAQPLAVGGTLVVTTENDKAYGLDEQTGALKWARDVGPAWPASAINCGDLTPNLGSTATPVYDSASNAVYFTTKVNDGADVQHPHWYLHAVDPATGTERSGWPVVIAGTPANDPSTPFNSFTEQQRPGLLLLDGVVYMAFGSHCDHNPYRGYVVGVSTSTAKMTALWATESGSSNEGAGIWQSGGGLVSDGSGRIIVATGNGINPPPEAGSKAATTGTLSESVVRLQVNSNGSLTPADFFSPSNAPTLDLNDTDLASGGPMGLPSGFGTSSHPHLLVEQGKDGRIFLLDRDNLGGRSQGSGGGDAIVGVTGPYQGQWGHPAFWGGDGGYVYVVGNNGPLRALKYGVTGSGNPALSLAGTSKDTFPYTSGSPIVTSDGTTSGSALVWVVWSGGPTGVNAQLRAYAATPDSNGTLPLVWSAPIGTAVKFATAASDGNRVFVGTRDGKVIAFGRPAQTELTAAPVDFGNVDVNTTGSATAVLTASKDVTITAVGASAPFGATAPTLPVSLTSGQQLQVPVSFTPTAAGGASGALTVTTSDGTFVLSLHGNGTKPGLGASPSSVGFGQQPTGTSATINVQVTNTGTGTETISGTTLPSAPFSATGLPAAGTAVPPGGSFVATVTYAPTVAQNDSSSITVTSTHGTLTIPVTGAGIVGQGHLTFTPAAVDFGNVPAGTSRTLSFDVANTGNIPVTVTKAKAPATDFTSSNPLAEGLVIGPGQVVHQTVTFTPSTLGTQTSSYEVTGDAGQGAMLEPLTGTGTGTLPAPATGTWSANGTAAIQSNGVIKLNGAVANSAGSSFYTQTVPTDGLQANFTAQFGPGTGADGLTFAMIDATKAKTTALGYKGGGLGFSGIPGVAVGFTTYNSNNVGVLVGPNSGTDKLTWLATAKVPTALRTGTHTVGVSITGGHLKVSVDGKQLLDTTPPLPASAYVGFTAATGAYADAHTISAVAIKSGGSAVGQPLTPQPTSVDFGTVPVGSTKQLSLVLKNNGTQQQIVYSSDAPSAPFTATLPATGTVVPAGGSVTVPVVYAPTATGGQTGSLDVTTTSGTATVPLTGTGAPVAAAGQPIPGPTDPSWVRNGSAVLSGSDLLLTKAGGGASAGSSWYGTAVPVHGLHASFTAAIGGGKGADGMTFALLDPTGATTASIGGAGGALGFTGLPGVAVALDTYQNPGDVASNFVGIATSAVTSTGTAHYISTTTAVPALRTGTHVITVDYTAAGHLVVHVDGVQVLDTAVTLPPSVLVGFTAGQGGYDDNHIVRAASITAGS